MSTGLSSGAKNMAIDEFLATRLVPLEQVPVFRIYAWQPYAISLGYGQKREALDVKKCEEDGFDIVRRPTGGRAVFHAEEITYSVIIPITSASYSPEILAMYKTISRGLSAGLRLSGINAELVKREIKESKSSAYKNNIPCFSFSAQYEIAFNNKKLVGSAQRRYKQAVLQHGSILTGNFHMKLVDYILFISESEKEHFRIGLEKSTISIFQIINCEPDQQMLVENLKLGMQQSFDIEFIERQLTPQDLKEVDKMIINYLN